MYLSISLFLTYPMSCFLSENITCVAANSATGMVVTGLSNGEILVWHNIPEYLRTLNGLQSGAVKSGKKRKAEKL